MGIYNYEEVPDHHMNMFLTGINNIVVFIDDDDVMYSCIQFINTHSECSLWHADLGINDTDQNLVENSEGQHIIYYKIHICKKVPS